MALAYSYCRVSTGGQASEKRSGLQRQEDALREWLRHHRDYQLAETLIDPGVSAYSGRNRQMFEPFLGGGLVTALSPVLIASWGLPRFSAVALALTLASLVFGLRLGRAR